MFTLTHLTTPPPEAFASQVQQLALDNLTTLGSAALAPSNPLYPLYQYVLGLEVHHYLQAMGRSPGMPVELLLALDAAAPDTLLGFALWLPAPHAAGVARLQYLAVTASARNNGVGGALLAEVAARYRQCEALCGLASSLWLQAQGWHLLAPAGAQVFLGNQPTRAPVNLPGIDVAPLFHTLEVRQIHAYLLKQHGARAMAAAERQRDAHLDQLEREAARLFTRH